MRVSGAGPEPPASTPRAQHASPRGRQSEASPVPRGTTGDRRAGLAQMTLPIGRTRPEMPAASRGEALEDPFALSPVRHVSQGGRAVPQASEDDAVVQAVGLALPELHDVWLQDVAPPGRETRGFRGTPPVGSALPAAPATHQYAGFGTAVSLYRSSSSAFFFLKYCGEGEGSEREGGWGSPGSPGPSGRCRAERDGRSPPCPE